MDNDHIRQAINTEASADAVGDFIKRSASIRERNDKLGLTARFMAAAGPAVMPILKETAHGMELEDIFTAICGFAISMAINLADTALLGVDADLQSVQAVRLDFQISLAKFAARTVGFDDQGLFERAHALAKAARA